MFALLPHKFVDEKITQNTNMVRPIWVPARTEERIGESESRVHGLHLVFNLFMNTLFTLEKRK